MEMRDEFLRIKGEPKGIGSCLDMPAREAMVSDTRDRARDNSSAPQTARLEGLPGSQMLLLEEYLLWLGIWVQCFPFKEENEGSKGSDSTALRKCVLFESVYRHDPVHIYTLKN